MTRVDHAHLLQGILHGQGIHDRGQHAHVVTGDPVHAGSGQALAPKDVTATDDQGELNARVRQPLHLRGKPAHDAGIDTELAAAHEGLAAKFEQNPPIG